MSKVRVLGPRERLDAVLDSLQDFGLMHLGEPAPIPQLKHVELTSPERRRRRQLRRIVEDIETVLAHFPEGRPVPPPEEIELSDLARWARTAARVRGRLEGLGAQEAELREEQALLSKYRGFFAAFRPMLERVAGSRELTAIGVVLRGDGEDAVSRLGETLREETGAEFTLETHRLETGDLALLLVLHRDVASKVEKLLAEAGVAEVPVPDTYGAEGLASAAPRMLERLEEIPDELRSIERERRDLERQHGDELRRARAAVQDRLEQLEARTHSGVTAHAFVIGGWIPAEARAGLENRLAEDFGGTVVVEELSKEEWSAEEAPVVLSNPRLFRPFETLVSLLPLPTYGSIDPTPYVAVFFPMFFGLILGDVGYGLLLAAVGLLLYWRSAPEGTLRTVSEIIGPCALFTIIFGFLYGELFGDLGRRWFGLEPLALNREEAILPFLGLAIALGLVHIVLGLVLGMASAIRGHPRQAMGRGIAAVMVLLIVVALLAALQVLPGGFFTPSVVALLLLFPLLVVAEGLVAPVEFLSTLGNVLSYARIMALGTASVMLAVVANRMVGALGGALVGILFGLLFHLVNFAVGVFSPTIHALRLHYVEFFGKFYSPGGVRYQPFGHGERGKRQAAPGRR